MKRRDFIRYGLNLGGLTAAGLSSPWQALAQTRAKSLPRIFITIRATGGMHAAMALDPIFQSQLEARGVAMDEAAQGRDYYIGYREDEIIRAEVNGRDLFLGPAAEALRPILSDVAIVNGIVQFSESPVHPSNLQYISSGDRSLKAPGFAYQLLSLPESVIGASAQGYYSLKRGLETMTHKKSNVKPLQDLISLAASVETMSTDPALVFDQLRAQTSLRSEDPFVMLAKDAFKRANSYQAFGAILSGAFDYHTPAAIQIALDEYGQEALSEAFEVWSVGGETALAQLLKEGPQVEKLSDLFEKHHEFFQGATGSATQINLREPSQRKEMIAAMGAGLVQSVVIDSEGAFDAHNNYRNGHRQNVSDLLTEFTSLILDLKAAPVIVDGAPLENVSLFDCATVMLCSDFSRTAWREGSSGTAHNPRTNSVILAGGGVRGGHVLGRSYYWPSFQTKDQFSRHQGLPYDFNTGKIVPGNKVTAGLLDEVVNGSCAPLDSGGDCVDYIFPENIYSSVCDAMGLEVRPALFDGVKPIKGLAKA